MKEKFKQLEECNIGQQVCVDEHMVKGKGKNPFNRYLPMKTIKIWELACSCCGYLYDFQVHTGKSGGNSEKGLAHQVVRDLVMQLHDKETVVNIDKLLTSPPLLQELYIKQIYSGEFHTVASGTTVCTVWKDTAHVFFLSNVHSSHGNSTISRKLRRGKNVILPCPPCAVDYNKNMGAVDRHDQLVNNYAIDRKWRRWWVRIFLSVLDAIMVNAYIIYKEYFKIMNMPQPQNPTNPLVHDKFMSGVVYKLIGNFSCNRQPAPSLALPSTIFHGRNHDSVRLNNNNNNNYINN